jgi:hypothetical protein
MNITNTMCRLADLTQGQIQRLVDAMPESSSFDFGDDNFIGVTEAQSWGTWEKRFHTPKIVTYTEMMQLLGKTMKFTKSDLIKLAQSETVFVKYRKGGYRILLGNVLTGDGWIHLNDFNDDLLESIEGTNKLDIMSVYTIKNNHSISSYFKGSGLKLIWERTEQTPAQKELALLQEQITALQEQAKVLQAKL